MPSASVSVIIPVWNGASSISECLTAVFTHSGHRALEVICVDNASPDGAGDLIRARYPQVILLTQPVNLGFAGGVNAGLDAAQNSVRVLLNQDCIVQPGWLPPLVDAVRDDGPFGIAGATILDASNQLNHAGARLVRPEARGEHLAELDPGAVAPRAVELVTGAVFAISHRTWHQVGHFDDGFYPAYFEETDYCLRAARLGLLTAHAPLSRVTHLFTGQEWRREPLRHTANQHRSRYRLVVKHYSPDEMTGFFEAERAAIIGNTYFDQAVGRAIAARDTLRGLEGIFLRRAADLGDSASSAHRRQAREGFGGVLLEALIQARAMTASEQPFIAVSDPPDLELPRDIAPVTLAAPSPEFHDHEVDATTAPAARSALPDPFPAQESDDFASRRAAYDQDQGKAKALAGAAQQTPVKASGFFQGLLSFANREELAAARNLVAELANALGEHEDRVYTFLTNQQQLLITRDEALASQLKILSDDAARSADNAALAHAGQSALIRAIERQTTAIAQLATASVQQGIALRQLSDAAAVLRAELVSQASALRQLDAVLRRASLLELLDQYDHG